MSTFGDLQSHILDDLNRTDMTSQVQLAIKQAVKFYNEYKAYWFQEERKETTAVANTEYYTLPTDFKEMDTVSITEDSDTYVIEDKPFAYIEDRSNPDLTSRPQYFCLYDQQIRLYPIPDQSYTLNIAYKRNLDEVTATAAYTSNWFTVGYELIRHRATADVFLNTLHDDQSGSRSKSQEAMAEMSLDHQNQRRLRTGSLKRHL